MPSECCPNCGVWGCYGCDFDDDSICQFCGEYECDGSGYNCNLDDYNLPERLADTGGQVAVSEGGNRLDVFDIDGDHAFMMYRTNPT